MATPTGSELAQLIRSQSDDFKAACEGLSEADASYATEGRWTAKEIVSHLLGPEGIGNLPMLKRILEEDHPLIEMVAEDPFFSEKRSKMTLAGLLAALEKEYGQMADLAAGLTEDQLNRKARIPLFKETPLGENPTLAEVIQALAGYHLGFHIDHLKEIRAESPEP
jgi:hypothetical protein